MAEKPPGWLDRFLLPKLSSIEGELKGLRGELTGFKGEVEGEFKAVHSETRRLDEKIDSLRNESVTRFDSMDRRFDFAKDLGILQSKVTELEARLPKP